MKTVRNLIHLFAFLQGIATIAAYLTFEVKSFGRGRSISNLIHREIHSAALQRNGKVFTNRGSVVFSSNIESESEISSPSQPSNIFDVSNAAKKRTQVMFVCRRNSCRSQMAEGLAKNFISTVGNQLDDIGVYSSGLIEGSYVHPTAITVMADIGIDITHQTSDALCSFSSDQYDAVICMCGCGIELPTQWTSNKTIFEEWDLDDPDGQPIETFYRVRDEIQDRVAELITKLER